MTLDQMQRRAAHCSQGNVAAVLGGEVESEKLSNTTALEPKCDRTRAMTGPANDASTTVWSCGALQHTTGCCISCCCTEFCRDRNTMILGGVT